ncbi:MAG: alanine racemase [Alphaproteobacteria bacterium]|nr:alanine racemase [Alphaproteobacteria bacterium]
MRNQSRPATGAELLGQIRMASDRLAVDAAGVLTVDGTAVHVLVGRFGSPLHVVVEATLRENYRRIRRAFTACWPSPVNVMYAIKCNNNLAIRAVMTSEGAGGDCFGLGELYATLAGGADPRLLVMNGSNKSLDEVAAAVALGVTINVDSVDEIDFLREAVRRTGRRATVNLRLKIMPDDLEAALLDAYRTPEGAAENVRRTKWGFTTEAAAPLVAALRAIEGVTLEGYSAHVGHLSTKPAAFASVSAGLGRAVRVLEQATGFSPASLDIGGGWAQTREPSARAFAINAFTIEDYARAATDALKQALGRTQDLPALSLEPGRYITSNAQLLLASVGALKRDAGLAWAHVDASTNDLPRIESGRHWYQILPATRMHAPLDETIEVVGSTCFKSVLGAARRMPALARGDIVAILDTGMYAEVFGNQFNGIPRPATVLLGDGGAEVIKRRETIADVFAAHRVPERLAAQAPRQAGSDAVLRWAAQGFDA